MKAYIFLANGYEEVEALTTVDILKRGGVDVTMVSMQEDTATCGAHGIRVTADITFAESEYKDADALILPGGMPGTKTLDNHKGLGSVLKCQAASGRLVAAICAAPSVLGHLGLLEGKKAVCFPGFESELIGAKVLGEGSLRDGNVVTGRSMGTAVDFALTLFEAMAGKSAREGLEKSLHR